eukprot:GHUV01024516.1.p1 GENE.GHUV01024516.1~~GHUV01024516.1.p1  ORF type:complete len:180 (+),score=6.74 GHUV01024516.1:700-1239(+)
MNPFPAELCLKLLLLLLVVPMAMALCRIAGVVVLVPVLLEELFTLILNCCITRCLSQELRMMVWVPQILRRCSIPLLQADFTQTCAAEGRKNTPTSSCKLITSNTMLRASTGLTSFGPVTPSAQVSPTGQEVAVLGWPAKAGLGYRSVHHWCTLRLEMGLCDLYRSGAAVPRTNDTGCR